MTLYADNSLYILCNRKRSVNQDNIDNVFHKIKNYLNTHGLQINESKTVLSEIMSQQKQAKIQGIPPYLTVSETVRDKIKDRHITDSQYLRLLGINIKNNMSHLLGGKKALLPAIRKQIGALHSIRNLMSRKARLHMVNTLILSRLSYAVSVLGNTTENMILKLQRVQNLAGDRTQESY